MALIDVGNDPWVSEQNACERLCREIQSQIVLRNREPSLSQDYSKISGAIRIRLKQITLQIETLNQQLTLAGKSRSITPGELERRQRQVEELQSKLVSLRTQFAAAPGGRSTQITASPSLWQNDDGTDDDQILSPDQQARQNENYSVEDLKQQQIHMIEDQNQGLEALSKVISRQKHLALRIGEEVESQNDILDELADQMESTDSRVTNETRRIGVIAQKDATCGYWTVIVILFVAILIVTFV